MRVLKDTNPVEIEKGVSWLTNSKFNRKILPIMKKIREIRYLYYCGHATITGKGQLSIECDQAHPNKKPDEKSFNIDPSKLAQKHSILISIFNCCRTWDKGD